VFDEELEIATPGARQSGALCAYWDVDAPATLDEIASRPAHHLRRMLPQYDMVFTYGGGEPVVSAYLKAGARSCTPIYNAVDPETHHPAPPVDAWNQDVGFLGNRLPDREARVEEFFLKPAALLPRRRFLLGGSGWGDKDIPANVLRVGHVGTADHNAFFCSPLSTLNVNRSSMARYGFSPPTRVFEAAGAGACIITDEWVGIELFLEPGAEVLVASDGEAVARFVDAVTPVEAQRIGEAARARILAQHTYDHRAVEVMALLGNANKRREAAWA
jgi:spore maturation protein CgeB